MNRQNQMDFFQRLDKSVQKELMDYLNQEGLSLTDQHEACINYLMSRSHLHPEFDEVAVQLAMEHHRSQTSDSFVKTVISIQQNRDLSGIMKPLLHLEFFQFIQQNADEIEKVFQECVEECGKLFSMTFFGWKTLYKTYLIRTHEGVQERVEHLFFRVSLFLYRQDYENVKKTFGMFLRGEAIHATPTLFHAGLLHPQMASCFLVGTEDSVSNIFKTVSDVAMISKYAGGIGIHISNIRGENSYIHGTNGKSNGIMPMLRIYNATARYIDQCFEGNVPVLTDRGWIPISEIQENKDSVLSSDGFFHRVKKVILHENTFEMMVVQSSNAYWRKQSYRCTVSHDLLFLRDSALMYESCERATYDMKPVWMDISAPFLSYSLERDICETVGYLYRNMKSDPHRDRGILVDVPASMETFLELFLERYYQGFWERDGSRWEWAYQKVSTVLDWQSILEHTIPIYVLYMKRDKLELFYKGFSKGKEEERSDLIDRQLQTLEYRLLFSDQSSMIPAEVVFHRQADFYTGKVYDLEIENCPSYQTMIGMAHNGGGKRKGAFAMYIEPWHSDILQFVMARRPTGHEEERARDLFYGLWIPDRFMEIVEADGIWYLMGEEESKVLVQTWGSEFNRLYDHFVETGRYVKTIKARDLWIEILKSQIETGTPYMLYKDTCNRLSNQKNVGTIRSSNLCCEIIQYSDEKEYAVCNLASISLKSCLEFESSEWKELKQSTIKIYGKPSCIYCQLLCLQLEKRHISYTYEEILHPTPEFLSRHSKTFPYVFMNDVYKGGFTEIWKDYLQPRFDYSKLKTIVQQLVENLNQVIDRNDYPLEECRRSNMKHRPMGIGVQGLADVFMEMLEPYDSETAQHLNRSIFEHIYFYALEKSMLLAKSKGSYSSFQGSPLSNGLFHFDLLEYPYSKLTIPVSDWEDLRSNIETYGIQNSLLVAPMPTASTSQILGNTESFEPLTSNLYLRRTNVGEFYVVNKVLYDLVHRLGMWNESFLHRLMIEKGSIQSFSEIPAFLRKVFRTVWEISTKELIHMASDRQVFIDQSQSFNIYLSNPDLSLLNKIHFYGWRRNLKTGSYYVRTRAPVSSQHFTIDPALEATYQTCESCSS